ncbi:MAG: hypothetical protein ACOCRK_07015 [bacterium]
MKIREKQAKRIQSWMGIEEYNNKVELINELIQYKRIKIPVKWFKKNDPEILETINANNYILLIFYENRVRWNPDGIEPFPIHEDTWEDWFENDAPIEKYVKYIKENQYK